MPSFVATNLEDLRREHPEANEDLEILKNAALIFYAGGFCVLSLSVTFSSLLVTGGAETVRIMIL